MLSRIILDFFSDTHPVSFSLHGVIVHTNILYYTDVILAPKLWENANVSQFWTFANSFLN